MSYYSEEQIKKARSIDLLTYLQTYEPTELVHVRGNTYCTRDHDSLKISNGKWMWWSRGFGGNSALDYLIKVKGIQFLDAMSILSDEKVNIQHSGTERSEKPDDDVKRKLLLPERNVNEMTVIWYLVGRGIDYDIIKECIDDGLIFESEVYHNCVFLGFDESGKAAYASFRSSSDNSRFKGEAVGSDKRYSFRIEVKSNTIHQQLKLAYVIALEDGIVGKNLMNSRKLSKRPKSSKKDRIVKGFTEEEQALFVKALEEDRIPRHRNNYKNQLKIELYTGMRMGEINALKKEDIDFDRRIIHVRGTISKGLNERNYLKDSTKTDKGIRDIPMNDLVRPVLEEAIEKAPRNKYGLIFYDNNKKDVIATQQVNCYFKRLCHKANIDVRGQHALRHTFATRCIEAGIPAVVLKEWMGHTNIHITLDTYADVFNRMNNEAIKMFEKYTCAIKYVEKTT